VTFAYRTTVSVLSPPGVDAWGDPTLGTVVETVPASVVDVTETVTDPATGRVSVVQQWELHLRKGTQDLTSVTQLQDATGRIFEVSSARQSPFRRGEWLVLAKVRAE
jgi:hypothetical protein